MSSSGMPWWVMATLAYLLVSMTTPGSLLEDVATHHGGEARRLEEVSSDTVQPAPFNVVPPKTNKNHSGDPTISMNVPCYLGITPCGNVTIPPKGLTMHFPLNIGNKTFGTDTLAPAVSTVEHTFAKYAIIFIIVAFLVLIIFKLTRKPVQAKMRKKWTRLQAGELESDSDDDRDEDDPKKSAEKAKELADRLDPKSKDFIAPGNIYRLLAVCHPGVIGWWAWLEFAVKAGICAYMQLFLPYKIIANTFKEWEIAGIKSPLWFIENALAFAAMFASLGSLCHVFQGKCATHMKLDAAANHYILVRYSDALAAEDDAAALEGAPSQVREFADKTYAELGKEYKISKPELTPFQVRCNEVFWCWLSMFLTIIMSIMLQFCMFLTIGTYTGKAEKVALAVVALYFIFDLDEKVMESDTKLRLKYRRSVDKLKTEYPHGDPKRAHARWLVRIAVGWIWFSHMITPLLLLGLVIFSWYNPEKGIRIGGSGLENTSWD
mmetsp:Transcript_99739/g.257707  ORF Transcript_99739/g.257707 Transcript_99739/m.257707 type:complete len:492 (+) Transcript_99739:58-1533(+)